jgi:hypothetical protein
MGNPNEEGRQSAQAASEKNSGPFMAKVISYTDPYYMGTIEVELLHKSGNRNARETEVMQAKYMSPFAGVTNVSYVDENNDYNSTQKSYGWWAIPPDIGSTVLVFFVDGDSTKAYWIGCIPDPNMNFMTPGYAATVYHIDGEEQRVPVAEYNKKASDVATTDTTKLPKPAHTFLQNTYTEQGLIKDDIRGITTSSARREIPSAVFGISTPGPIDKTGPKGKGGKFEHRANMFVSRLGGSSFVMDDGDDKWEREKTPSEGPPVYKSVEGGDTGLRDRPHNELIRLRTRTGHQILLHNSEDLIYIGNARGTAWIEFSSDGKIDIYAEDSVSLHTKQDINFYADRDINLEAGRNLNIKVAAEMHTHVLADQILIVDANQKIHIKANKDETVGGNSTYKIVGDYDTSAGGHIYETSGGSNETRAGGNIIETGSQIHMNGPTAATANIATLPKVLKTHSVPDEEGAELFQTIMRRVPTHEPWPHHENLDPEKYKPEKTDRDIDDRYEGNSESIVETPEYWKKYTTETDTFAKIKDGEET